MVLGIFETKPEKISISVEPLKTIGGVEITENGDLVQVKCTCGRGHSIDIDKIRKHIIEVKKKRDKAEVIVVETKFGQLEMGEMFVLRDVGNGGYRINTPLIKLPSGYGMNLLGTKTLTGVPEKCYKIIEYNKIFKELIPKNFQSSLTGLKEM